jgi:hypothetical protein
MAYSVPATAVIDYTPEEMESFWISSFEWIDNLHFLVPPERFLPDAAAHVAVARQAFLKAGWDGDGEIGLLWLPPFALPAESQKPWLGVTIWHVKQLEDGISWLLSPVKLPFEGVWSRYLTE